MQPVRRRITEILRDKGSATVAELAEQLGMAAVSVRHHLDILASEGLVELNGLRRRGGAGRPSQMYALTEDAYRLFPQRHDILTDHLLAELKAALPEAVVHEVLQRVAQRTVQEAPAQTEDQTVEERLAQVTDFLSSQGYEARWVARNDHYELHACNCPYAGVSGRHPEICLMDQVILQQLIPGTIRLESRVLDGTTHCRYLIPAGKKTNQTPDSQPDNNA
ncbi:MAG: Helix-turn-helix domain protein [Chloroflexi bacterium ADurb.Bin325]|nr:MAG: Helix-turn-helix domain protein [Chloroflexi bacterium ADurb.Bin325]